MQPPRSPILEVAPAVVAGFLVDTLNNVAASDRDNLRLTFRQVRWAVAGDFVNDVGVGVPLCLATDVGVFPKKVLKVGVRFTNDLLALCESFVNSVVDCLCLIHESNVHYKCDSSQGNISEIYVCILTGSTVHSPRCRLRYTNHKTKKEPVMAKQKLTVSVDFTEEDQRKAKARMNWERNIAAMAEGRRQRAVTFADRRKKASREACRGKNRMDWI